jgi:hypothetical protein
MNANREGDICIYMYGVGMGMSKFSFFNPCPFSLIIGG